MTNDNLTEIRVKIYMLCVKHGKAHMAKSWLVIF